MADTWSAKTRNEIIGDLTGRDYEIIIVGGGITGAGIARECSLRGISFCLLDKNDFAFGTSSRSSKLFHGGLRYLASGDFKLVRESTSERNWLRCHFPNLVRPLAFVYPSYSKSKATPRKVRLAVLLYRIVSDWFSPFKNYGKGKILKLDEVKKLEPAVALEDATLGKMTLAGFYYDTNCDDARVTLEIIKESLAGSGGSSSALNYARVEGFIKDSQNKVRGVRVSDELGGNRFEVRGSCVVSAAGIWTDEVLRKGSYKDSRIYPTKGVHVVVPAARLGNQSAFSLVSLDDGRFFFVLRRSRVSVIGTTDTAYYPESDDLDQPWCTRQDCDYLLRTVNRVFPQACLTDDDIISTFAGIRPLIRQEGAKHESDVSREHQIFQTEDGIVAIAGGKSTTHRRMAEDLLFYLARQGEIEPFSKREFSRQGFSKQPFKISITRDKFDQAVIEKQLDELVEPELLEHLYTQYGRGGFAILQQIKTNPQSGTPLLQGELHCRAEIEYILEHEFAPKLCDIMMRRTEAQWMVSHSKQPELAEKTAEIMADYYNWNEKKITAEINEYLAYVAKTVAFLKTK
jgi:glycerol-3-phosphate dehydrogenase